MHIFSDVCIFKLYFFSEIDYFRILTILKTIKESDHSCLTKATLKIFDLIACTFLGLITYGSMMRRQIEINYMYKMSQMDTYMWPWKQFDDRSLYNKGFTYTHKNYKHTCIHVHMYMYACIHTYIHDK